MWTAVTSFVLIALKEGLKEYLETAIDPVFVDGIYGHKTCQWQEGDPKTYTDPLRECFRVIEDKNDPTGAVLWAKALSKLSVGDGLYLKNGMFGSQSLIIC